MSTTDLILEILKYVVPAGFVLGGVGMVMRENRLKAETKEKYGILQQTFAEMMPLRLQAYERAILFLERISPDSIIIRVDGSNKTVQLFQRQLIAEIRAEYEHNIAQQLYIKNDSWEELVRAKEQTLALINATARTLPPDAKGMELGKRVLQEMSRQENSPTRSAIRALKSDVQQTFRF
ncbi:MAG: hypothetical protein AAGN35_05545 [Bacteroidota bacterium]